MFTSPGPIALQLGLVQIHWYGIIIGIGILFCYWYITSEIKRRSLSKEPIDVMVFWVILAGIIGARLYYVVFNLPYYSSHALEIAQIWKGGLAIHGALIGGGLAYTLYIAAKKIPWLLYADIIMPGVLLAQALGRFGNFFNNEAFGAPTDLYWRLFIPLEFRPQGFEEFSYFHPTFLYESLWNAIGFFILFFLARRIYNAQQFASKSGFIFFSYFIWYSFGRFFIEGLRLDSLYLGPFRAAQIVSVLLFIVGILGLFYVRKKSIIKNP